jgi:hypothetical protein
MKITLSSILNFWSYLICGVLCLFAGITIFVFGDKTSTWVVMLLILGNGQLLTFSCLCLKERYQARKNNK